MNRVLGGRQQFILTLLFCLWCSQAQAAFSGSSANGSSVTGSATGSTVDERYRANESGILVSVPQLTIPRLTMGYEPEAVVNPDRWRNLEEPKVAIQAMIDIIRVAHGPILSQSFIIDQDEYALAGLALLRQFARETQRDVYIIGDGLFNKLSRAMMKHLADEGVHVYQYHPLSMRDLMTHPLWLLQRMHDKSLFTETFWNSLGHLEKYLGRFGGRNYSKSYVGQAQKNYHDADVLLSGRMLENYPEYFHDVLVSDHVRFPKISRVPYSKAQEAAALLDQVYARVRAEAWFDEQPNLLGPENELGPSAQLDDAGNPLPGKGRLILNEVHGNKRIVGRVAEELFKRIEAATSDIYIVTPYLIPTQRLLNLFAKKKAQGIKIVILTSSAKYNDGWAPAGGYLWARKAVAAVVSELWEAQGPDALHAKIMSIVGQFGYVGSFNLDELSRATNTETVPEADSVKIAGEVYELIMRFMHNAKLIAKDGKFVSTPNDFDGVSLKKKLLIRCAQRLSTFEFFRRRL